MSTSPSNRWFKDGLRFDCKGCGACCRGQGHVWVSDEEITAIADQIGMPPAQFRRRYTYVVRGRGVSLMEKLSGDCMFWSKGAGCIVYEQRPKQCRTWPFWRGNLEQALDWKEASADCQGMDQGPLFSAEQIERTEVDDGLP